MFRHTVKALQEPVPSPSHGPADVRSHQGATLIQRILHGHYDMGRRAGVTPARAKPRGEQVLVRLPPEVYTALQLAQPFVRRRSMQDLLSAIIDDFIDALRSDDPGYQQALIGLRESQARSEGVLAKRRPTTSDRA